MNDRLRAALARGPVLLDAAMGTRLIARGLDPRHDDPSLWNVRNPEEVAEIHRRDVEAGSDAVLTNTFGANREWLGRYGRAGEVEEINRLGAFVARQAAGPDRFVIGVVGPTASDRPGACREQAEILADAGADALLFETFQAEPASRALEEARCAVSMPILISLVAWPEAINEWVRRLIDLGADVLGTNCQSGMVRAVQLAEALHAVCDSPLIVKPSAGLPGEPAASPESFAAAVPRLLALGVALIGGCCGTTEAHVAALRSGLVSWRGQGSPPTRTAP